MLGALDMTNKMGLLGMGIFHWSRQVVRSGRRAGRSLRRNGRTLKKAFKGNRYYQGPGCDIRHRTQGASSRCPYCRAGRTARAANTVHQTQMARAALVQKQKAKAAKTQARLERLYARYVQAASLAPNRVHDPVDFWPWALAADDTGKVRPLQRAFVRRQVRKRGRIRPALSGLTFGQAERILAAYGIDPAQLDRRGRGSLAMNILDIPLKLLALFVASFLSIAVFPLLFILIPMAAAGWVWGSAVRTYRRRLFERGWVEAAATYGAPDTEPETTRS